MRKEEALEFPMQPPPIPDLRELIVGELTLPLSEWGPWTDEAPGYILTHATLQLSVVCSLEDGDNLYAELRRAGKAELRKCGSGGMTVRDTDGKAYGLWVAESSFERKASECRLEIAGAILKQPVQDAA